MDEFNFIKKLVEGIARSPDQLNKPFESDSEIIKLGNRNWAFTIDEFSEDEDFFSSGDPFLLGWNLVIATISDLLAVGATPAFFLQVIGVPESMPQKGTAGGKRSSKGTKIMDNDRSDPGDFCDGLMKGVSAALKHNNSFLIGGDVSKSSGWRYVGNAIGSFDNQPILRTTEKESLCLYVTGEFGAGNLPALDRNYQVRLNSRIKEMESMRDHLALAMDTSDGLRNTLLTISRVNPRHALVADIDSAPIQPDVKAFCLKNRIPPEGFLFGSAGEYELLVGVEESNRAGFESAISRKATFIGKMTMENGLSPGLYWNKKGVKNDIADFPLSIDPRDGTSREKYVREIVSTVKRLFYP